MNVEESQALFTTRSAGQPGIWREWGGSPVARHLETLAAQVGVGVAAGLLFAWLAPFGTESAAPISRIGYWIVVLTAWFPISAGVRLIAHLSPIRRQSRPVRIVFRLLAPVPPMMLVCGLVTRSLFDWDGTPAEIAELFLQVAVVGYALELVGGLVRPRPPAEPDVRMAPDPAPSRTEFLSEQSVPLETSGTTGLMPPRLLDRVPHAIRSDIICLQMEDHYVRVHTRRGSCLVLMRLSDAVDELDGTPGLRVHRSWWVSRSAFGVVDRSTRAVRLRLADGRVVPVSRPHLEAVSGVEAEMARQAAAGAA